MNMLIIGNGFDLAHGRPTKYEDFLKFAEQIMRTKNFPGNKAQFENGLSVVSDLQPVVADYILSAFDTKIGSDGTNSNPVIQELYGCLAENTWYRYFQWIWKGNKARGKNWVDFESEIRNVIEFFDHEIADIYDTFPQSSGSIEGYPEKANEFYESTKVFEYNKTEKNRKHIKNYSDFIKKTYQDLQDLIRCLEIYLDDCVAQMPITCYSPDIQQLEIDSVLSFNYTKIPTNIYPQMANTHYIHGCARANRVAEENNMVLGVNEYWENSDDKDSRTNFNCYKKFVQRILKETGINYKSVLEHMRSKYEQVELIAKQRNFDPICNNIYIFGHSLDITDGDILREAIQTAGVCTTVFYKDKQQQADQIANLSRVLSQEELLKRVFCSSPTIIFQQQAAMKPLQVALAGSKI